MNIFLRSESFAIAQVLHMFHLFKINVQSSRICNFSLSLILPVRYQSHDCTYDRWYDIYLMWTLLRHLLSLLWSARTFISMTNVVSSFSPTLCKHEPVKTVRDHGGTATAIKCRYSGHCPLLYATAWLSRSASPPPSRPLDLSSKNSADRHAKSSHTKLRFECTLIHLLTYVIFAKFVKIQRIFLNFFIGLYQYQFRTSVISRRLVFFVETKKYKSSKNLVLHCYFVLQCWISGFV